jgi:hypothetical protein
VNILIFHLWGFKYNSESLHPGREEKGQQPQATDPAKKLRNLKKKLRDIEALEAKVRLFIFFIFPNSKYRTVVTMFAFRKNLRYLIHRSVLS